MTLTHTHRYLIYSICSFLLKLIKEDLIQAILETAQQLVGIKIHLFSQASVPSPAPGALVLRSLQGATSWRGTSGGLVGGWGSGVGVRWVRWGWGGWGEGGWVSQPIRERIQTLQLPRIIFPDKRPVDSNGHRCWQSILWMLFVS